MNKLAVATGKSMFTGSPLCLSALLKSQANIGIVFLSRIITRLIINAPAPLSHPPLSGLNSNTRPRLAVGIMTKQQPRVILYSAATRREELNLHNILIIAFSIRLVT